MSFLVVFIWLGSVLPEKYQAPIKACKDYKQNTCILLGQQDFQFYFQKYRDLLQLDQKRIPMLLPVQKADILRLLYLYDKGGIYSDLDNKINYDCLVGMLKERPDFFFGQEQMGEEPKPSNNFIYAASPHAPELLRIIKSIKNCMYCPVLDFASPYMLYRQKAFFQPVRSCVQHMYDYNWGSSQNKFKRQKQQALQGSKNIYFFIYGCIIVLLCFGLVYYRRTWNKKLTNFSIREIQTSSDAI